MILQAANYDDDLEDTARAPPFLGCINDDHDDVSVRGTSAFLRARSESFLSEFSSLQPTLPDLRFDDEGTVEEDERTDTVIPFTISQRVSRSSIRVSTARFRFA